MIPAEGAAPGAAPGAPRLPIAVHDLGPSDYRDVLGRMRARVRERIAARSPIGPDPGLRDGRAGGGGAGRHPPGRDPGDELWLTEHAPVYTLGRSACREHLHDPAGIPVVETERGGYVTYHGPGQLVAYPLLDLPRRGLGVRRYVEALEQAGIRTLAALGVRATRKPGAPGLYVAESDGATPGAKIASIGLKVTYGFSFHGLALNVAMDLAPFAGIDPCGYAGLAVTDVRRAGGRADLATARVALVDALVEALGG